MPKYVIAAALLASTLLSPVLPLPSAPAVAAQADRVGRDLADIAQGRYFGAVISDARGSSQSDVRITVTKIGPNRVRISADYPRLPTFEVALTRAMETIQNRGGDALFLLDLSKNPNALSITVDNASWAGERE